MCFQRLELIDKLEKLMASDEKSDTVRKELQTEFDELADSIKTIYKKEKDRLEDTVYQLELELSVSEIIMRLQLLHSYNSVYSVLHMFQREKQAFAKLVRNMKRANETYPDEYESESSDDCDGKVQLACVIPTSISIQRIKYLALSVQQMPTSLTSRTGQSWTK